MQQKQYFKAVPVSEKMERSNQLFCIDRYGFKSVRSNLDKPLAPIVTHYLQPTVIPDAAVLRSALERIIPVTEALVKIYAKYANDNPYEDQVSDQAASVLTIAREALSAGDGWVSAINHLPGAGRTVTMKWADGETEWKGNILVELSELNIDGYKRLMWKY